MTKFYYPGRWGFLIVCLTLLVPANRCAAQPTIGFFPILTGLSSPIDFVNAADGSDRVFIVQQGGVIRVYNSSFGSPKTFLTVTGIVSGGEQGLLSMAFHPDYENPNPAIGGFFYVYYTNTSSDLELARYHVSSTDADVADPSSKQVIMTIPHPTNTNHNGGKLLFGADGYLYFATGDGGGGGDVPNNAQRPDVLLGKMLRINVTNSPVLPFYTIPADNPYAGPGDPLDEIWAFGLRNPFRWSFDRANQNMWIGDVGQGEREEVNFRLAGTTGGINYGWRCYEGNLPFNTSGCLSPINYVFPAFDYINPPSGSAAVTGGVVYRGNTYQALRGYYLAADVYSGDVYLMNTATFLPPTIQPGLPGSIVCFGETESGEVFAVSLGGIVYQVILDPPLPVSLIQFTAASRSGITTLTWKTASEHNLKQFEIEHSPDGILFSTAGIVQAKNDINGADYSYVHPASFPGRLFYRLKMVDFDASFDYSAVVSISLNPNDQDFVHPSVITTGVMNIFIEEAWQSLEVSGINGATILKKNITGQTGKISIPVNAAMRGVYLVRLRNGWKAITQKILILP